MITIKDYRNLEFLIQQSRKFIYNLNNSKHPQISTEPTNLSFARPAWITAPQKRATFEISNSNLIQGWNEPEASARGR